MSTYPPCNSSPRDARMSKAAAALYISLGSLTDRGRSLLPVSMFPPSYIIFAWGALCFWASMADKTGIPVPAKTTAPSQIKRAPQMAMNSCCVYFFSGMSFLLVSERFARAEFLQLFFAYLGHNFLFGWEDPLFFVLLPAFFGAAEVCVIFYVLLVVIVKIVHGGGPGAPWDFYYVVDH